MGKVDQDAIAAIQSDLARAADPDTLARIKAKPRSARTAEETLTLKKEAARQKIISAVQGHGSKRGSGPASGYADKTLDFNDLKITVFNATNKPPKKGKIGFDRDITYQVELPLRSQVIKNPKTGRLEVVRVPGQKIDVPADLVAEHYNSSLYANLNPGKTVPDPDGLTAFGNAMDHQVTDSLHSDAYRLDLDHISDFFKDPALLARQGDRIDGFSDTVTYKSRHWFDMAEKTADQGEAMAQVAEGMRQAAKQKENYMDLLVAHYGLSYKKAMAPRLQKGLHIFEMVRANKISVPDAEAALAAIGMTKEQVVNRFGQQFEALVKLSRDRAVKLAKVKKGAKK